MTGVHMLQCSMSIWYCCMNHVCAMSMSSGWRIGILSSDTNSCALLISHIIIRMGISANLAMFWRTMHGSSSPVLGMASSTAQVVMYSVVQLVGVGNSSNSQHGQSVTYGLTWWCITVYRWMYMKNKLNIYSVYTREIQKWIHDWSIHLGIRVWGTSMNPYDN